jgi:hypothetical protein
MKKILTSLIVSILSISSLYGAYNDANTDYTNAKTDFWTKVDALAPLEAINQIICFTQQLRPELMVNKGVYSALIDNKKCSKSKSTTQNTENEYILADVVREDNTSSQIMNIWIPKDDVKVRMEVIKEASTANPIGQFNITWKLFKLGIETGEAEIKTILTDDGKIGYTLYMNFNNVKNISSIIKNSNGSQGKVLTLNGYKNKTYALSWDDNIAKNLVLSQVHNKEVSTVKNFDTKNDIKACQDKSKYTKSVWSYGVYKKDDGSLLTINTGFPFEGEKDGKIIQGYIGHWGIWIEGDNVEGKSLNAISDIKKINYTNNTKIDITISKVNNKFIAKYINGDEIPFDKPITLKDNNNNSFMYGGNGSLWYSDNTNQVVLNDKTILNYNGNDYVVKALQGENTLQNASGGQSDCNNLTLEDPAEPLPISISTFAIFNEDNIPNRPTNVSIVNGELKN